MEALLPTSSAVHSKSDASQLHEAVRGPLNDRVPIVSVFFPNQARSSQAEDDCDWVIQRREPQVKSQQMGVITPMYTHQGWL